MVRRRRRDITMFVQIIEGRAADVEGMQRLMQTWVEELRPGAAGFLGTTAGVTPDGWAIALARFESADAARANSDRPEQGEWWEKMATCYDGEVSFTESDDVDVLLGGGSDDAGFVQVMKFHDVDRETIGRLDSLFEMHAPAHRPDIVGGIRAWTGQGEGYDVTYFTTEAEAREGEQKPFPPEFDEVADDLGALMANTEFLDLSDPWLH